MLGMPNNKVSESFQGVQTLKNHCRTSVILFTPVEINQHLNVELTRRLKE